MFKVLLNNFLHTTLSSSSQNELDFVIFHILQILHILSKGIGLYDFADFESQTEKCLHSGPAVYWLRFWTFIVFQSSVDFISVVLYLCPPVQPSPVYFNLLSSYLAIWQS